MSDSQEAVARLLASPQLTAAEKEFLMEVQLCRGSASDFWRPLWAAMIRADADNLARLGRGFPEEAAAVESWRHGDLGARARALDPENVLGI